MRYVERIADNVWKIRADSNVYFLDFCRKILIDTGNRASRNVLIQFLKPLVAFEKIEKIIFTHLHYDHIGNFDLFNNAKLYASEQAINDFSNNPFDTVLNEDMVAKFNRELIPVKDEDGLRIISAPGHTRGSICIWYEKEKLLFSGDTLFSNKQLGRTDLPTSDSANMQNSIMKLLEYNFRILCPGHDY
jgi:hydroxyacylglutathione hydrolase